MEQFYYDNKIVKNFLYATLFWGVIGMSVGLLFSISYTYRRDLLAKFWSIATTTHQCCDLCFCRKCYFCGELLLHAAPTEGSYV